MGATSAWRAPPGWRALRAMVFARYGRQCWRGCGRPATTVGHVVARALGGTWELSNLRPECQPCNSSDGARLKNRLYPARALTGRQRQAIALKARQAARRW
jgi:5-methylcytosine-specific restriction endonuclease McrA